MKDLRLEFTGIGEVKGFNFKQLRNNGYAYLYEITTLSGNKHYEVFEKRENTKFDCVSYPRGASFGYWAKCCINLDKAEEYFEIFTNDVKSRIEKRNDKSILATPVA